MTAVPRGPSPVVRRPLRLGQRLAVQGLPLVPCGFRPSLSSVFSAFCHIARVSKAYAQGCCFGSLRRATCFRPETATLQVAKGRAGLKERFRKLIWGDVHTGHRGGLDIIKAIGPGLLVMVGFIDPGNWASNLAAGSTYGYSLLWVVTLATVLLIVLQHNVAHLGIVSGKCLAEAATDTLPRPVSVIVLSTAMLACVATVMAEVLGGAIALQMLFGLPIRIGAVIVAVAAVALLLTNSYKRIERWIIAFVSVIGLSFLIEIFIVNVDWPQAAVSWVRPSFPDGSAVVVMAVIGAVIMPHNLFLHSEVVQSHRYDEQGEDVIERRLSDEFVDTLFSMAMGWAINSAIVIVAASTFFQAGVQVDDLAQAAEMLKPLAGETSSLLFAGALLLAGVSSSVTAGMASGTVSAGIMAEPFDLRDRHSSFGVISTFVLAVAVIFFVQDPFQGLVLSQAALAVQLPITIFLQIYLTSSKRVMGKYANGRALKVLLICIGVLVVALNLYTLVSGS